MFSTLYIYIYIVNLLADEFGAVGLLFDSVVAKIKKNIRKSIYY